MIIREREDEFVLVCQYDHAQLSGWLAALWGGEEPEPSGPLRLAALLHDVAWAPLDAQPLWNAEAQRPYSFLDLPNAIKLPGYQAGIDQAEREDPYTGLLCSLHYPGLIPESLRGDPAVAAFIQAEEARQIRLAAVLQAAGRQAELARAQQDLQLVRLWDEMSLYIAMNEPGAMKPDEHHWFRDGFSPVITRPDGSSIRFHARWLDSRRIALHPFPLRQPMAHGLPYRVVGKDAIRRFGFAAAYGASPRFVQVITFVPEQMSGTYQQGGNRRG